ncbi:MAG: hypothetical protein OXF02_01110 [Simkaniaceae bacterium]|nr:hypothetical protein [Simkaniaceae bacterium]
MSTATCTCIGAHSDTDTVQEKKSRSDPPNHGWVASSITDEAKDTYYYATGWRPTQEDRDYAAWSSGFKVYFVAYFIMGAVIGGVVGGVCGMFGGLPGIVAGILLGAAFGGSVTGRIAYEIQRSGRACPTNEVTDDPNGSMTDAPRLRGY